MAKNNAFFSKLRSLFSSNKKNPLQQQIAQKIAFWEAVDSQSTQTVKTLSGFLAKQANGAAISARFSPLLEELKEALEQLRDAGKNPELTIAVTGTTSSGKSTLLNALIGREILPTGVQEVSAGAVILKHGKNPSVTVCETQGATWECGTFKELADREICTLIEKNIEAYRAAEKENPDIEPLRIEITYPTAIGNNSNFLNLPEGAKLTLIDLPGLKSVGDKNNSAVISNYIKSAFCIIAYNSEETDPVKQKALVDQVAVQISALRQDKHALSRVFLVLNRIDAFYRESNPEKREAEICRFESKVLEQVKEALCEKIPEARAEIQHLQALRLAAWPACLAIGAESDPALLGKTKHATESLLPKELSESLGDLPGNPQKWPKTEQQSLIRNTLEFSGFQMMKSKLAEKIREEFPLLVLGEAHERLKSAFKQLFLALSAEQAALSITNQAEKEALISQLHALEEKLRKAAEETLNSLKEAEHSCSGNDPAAMLKQWASFLQKKTELPAEKMAPFVRLQEDLFAEPKQSLVNFCMALAEGTAPVKPEIGLGKLQNRTTALLSSPFGRIWEKGGSVEAEAREEIVQKVEGFAEELQNLYVARVEESAQTQMQRIKVSLDEISEKLLIHLKHHAEEIICQIESGNSSSAFKSLASVFEGEIPLPSFQEIRSSDPLKIEGETWTEIRSPSFFEGILTDILDILPIVELLQLVPDRETQAIGHGAKMVGDVATKLGLDKISAQNKHIPKVKFPSFSQIIEKIVNNPELQDAFLQLMKNYVEELQKIFSETLETRLEKGIKQFQNAFDEHLDRKEADWEVLDHWLKNSLSPELEQLEEYMEVSNALFLSEHE